MEGGETAPTGAAKDGGAATSSVTPAASETLAAVSSSAQGGGEDGGHLAVGAQAKEAAALFHSARYTECLAVLYQLLLKKEDDLKVQHNIAIAEFYRDGCTEPQKLLETLSKLKSLATSDRQAKTEELARDADEQVEASGSSFGTLASSSTGGNAKAGSGVSIPAASSSTSPCTDAVASAEDYDTSFISLNTAVILFYMRQYAKSLSVLESLYRNIEPIDETAAIRICQLILDITLSSGQPGRAAVVLQYMEKAFGYLLSSGDSGATAQTQAAASSAPPSTTGVAAPSGPPENSSIASSSTSGASSLIASPSGETGLLRTSSEEVLDDEALSIELEIEGSQGVRSVPAMKGVSRSSGVQKPSPISVELKLAIILYKVRLLLHTRNLKGAKREVKSALNLSRENLAALILKAQLEYTRGNHRKAVKILTTCNSRSEDASQSMFLSNLGCIHHRLQKDHLASFYFLKALQSCAPAEGKVLDLITHSQDKSLSILYNAGLQRLACGDPVLASKCLQEAGCLYYNQPILWLRLAECTMVALEKNLLDAPPPAFPAVREELRVSVVGDGKLRRVILPGGSLNPTLKHSGSWEPVFEDSQSSSEGAKPEQPLKFGKPHRLSVTFARQCLKNALFLVTRQQARATEAASPVAKVQKENDEGKGESGSSSSPKAVPLETKGGTSGSNGATGQVNQDGDGKETKATSSSLLAGIAAYEEEKRKELSYLRQLVLANLAYVELCLENPVVALSTVKTLFAQPGVAKTLTFLGHMYAAEALCMLDRTKEAAEHLSKCMEESNMAEASANGTDDDSGQKWKSVDNSEASVDGDEFPNADNSPKTGGHLSEYDISRLTGSQARSALYVNLAAVHIMQGDLDQAYQMATQAAALAPGSAAATLSVVFVHLSRGQPELAVTLLKNCRSLYVIPKAGNRPKD